MRYIDLSKPHGYLIWKGKQKAIVSPELLPSGEKMLLVQEGQEAFGEVVLSAPAQINLTEFQRLEEEHATRTEERKLKWAGKESFYIYRFKEWQPFQDSRDVEIENGHAQLIPIQSLTEDEKQLLEMAERLPKTLILKDEAVRLEDGQAIFCEGLDGSKIMPILSATFDDKAIGDILPLYQLALVRIPKLKLKKKLMEAMMEEDDKAEGTKPYKIMTDHEDCEGQAVVKVADGSLMGCHDTQDEAAGQVAALYAADDEEEKGGRGSGRPRGSSNRTTRTRKPKKEGSGRKEQLAEIVEELAELIDLSEEEQKELEEDTKEMSLEQMSRMVRNSFQEQYYPMPKSEVKYDSQGYIHEVYPDYVICGLGGKMYKVDYSKDENGKIKFADKNKWVEMEHHLMPTGNVGAKGIWEGFEEAVKEISFTDWLTDYYELATKSVEELTEEETVKAVWSTAFVNRLPDASFLYIKPDCGEKDEEGMTKPRSCRMFPYKSADGAIDLPHLRNAIARAPQANLPDETKNKIQKKAQALLAEQNKEDEGEKAGRKVKKTMMDKVRKAWDTLKEFMEWAEPEDEEHMGMMSLFSGKSAIGIKKVGDQWWYVTYSTNAFKDREAEIFSTKSLEKYVSEAETKGDRGYFNLWHIGTKENPSLTDFAEKKWQGVAGRFLVESGPFLSDKKGQAALKFFQQYSDGHPELAPEGWGCSPEYKYLPEERKKGVYENIWITRTSTLPKMAAANIWTNGGITMALTAEQKKSLETIFGDDAAKEIISVAETKTKELEEAGVGHKSVDEQETQEEVKEVPTVEAIVEKVAEKMTTDFSPIQALLQEIATKQKGLEDELVALKTEVQGAKSEEAKELKDNAPKYVWSLVERASEAAKTIVPDEDPLKDKKPAEAVKSDKSGAAAFFGK